MSEVDEGELGGHGVPYDLGRMGMDRGAESLFKISIERKRDAKSKALGLGSYRTLSVKRHTPVIRPRPAW